MRTYTHTHTHTHIHSRAHTYTHRSECGDGSCNRKGPFCVWSCGLHFTKLDQPITRPTHVFENSKLSHSSSVDGAPSSVPNTSVSATSSSLRTRFRCSNTERLYIRRSFACCDDQLFRPVNRELDLILVMMVPDRPLVVGGTNAQTEPIIAAVNINTKTHTTMLLLLLLLLILLLLVIVQHTDRSGTPVSCRFFLPSSVRSFLPSSVRLFFFFLVSGDGWTDTAHHGRHHDGSSMKVS